MDSALRNSPLLKDYQLQVLSSQYDSLLLLAAYKPQVTGNSFNSYAPVIHGYGYDEAITNGANFSALIGVNKQLMNHKLVSAQVESIRLQNQKLSNNYKITEQDLQRTIATQYITTYGGQQQLKFNREVQQLLSNEEAILKKLTQQNVYKQADYLAFLVTLQQQQLLVKQISIQLDNDLATLNYLTGIIDTASVELEDPDLKSPVLPQINNSVFFQQYSIDSMNLVNSKLLVGLAYKPKINLFADAGYNSSLAYKAYKNFGTSFGISATIPLYDGKQRKLQENKIVIAERTRQNYKSFFTDQYTQQIAQFTRQLRATEELINDINNQLKYSKSLVEVNGRLLQTGEVRIADYILSLNNYLAAKNLVTQNMISRLQIINQVNYWNR
ncbi:MAG: TolC family protein [Ferruginibacter sp.]